MGRSRFPVLLGIVILALAGWAVIASGGDERAAETAAPQAAPAAEADSDAAIVERFLAPAEPVGKGGPNKGPKCCDPAAEPGVGGNPFCFEGHTCCSDGQWRCNNPDATPSCEAGQVCDAGCGSAGTSCGSGADCCSGTCRGGRCK